MSHLVAALGLNLKQSFPPIHDVSSKLQFFLRKNTIENTVSPMFRPALNAIKVAVLIILIFPGFSSKCKFSLFFHDLKEFVFPKHFLTCDNQDNFVFFASFQPNFSLLALRGIRSTCNCVQTNYYSQPLFPYLVNLGKFPLKQRFLKFLHVCHDRIVARHNRVKSCGSGPQKTVIYWSHQHTCRVRKTSQEWLPSQVMNLS